MPRVVPSQVVAVIDQLFTEVAKGVDTGEYSTGHKQRLHAVATLAKQVPADLLTMPPESYSDFVVGIATIELQIDYWHARGGSEFMPRVRGTYDPVALIRKAMSQCRDDSLRPGTSELVFVTDGDLRDSIRRDASAANQALHNDEWKAATVLAGSAIEALLLWRLREADKSSVFTAVATLVQQSALAAKPDGVFERWTLHEFMEVAAFMSLIRTDTAKAVSLAKDFRNLIHPGRATRVGLTCDRATALSAVAALEHVIRDLTP